MLRPGLLLLAIAVSATFAEAQNPAAQPAADAPTKALPNAPAPEGRQWQRVQALPVNTYIQVSAGTRPTPCTVKAVDAGSLTCERDTGVGFTEITLQRAEIEKVKVKHRGRSALLGAGIGAVSGAVIAGVAERNNHSFAVRAAFPMIWGFTGLFAGAPIGYLSDFAASTIYRAP